MNARHLVMESAEWITVGNSLDAVYKAHDRGTMCFVKQRWDGLRKELKKIEAAARKARKVMEL